MIMSPMEAAFSGLCVNGMAVRAAEGPADSYIRIEIRTVEDLLELEQNCHDEAWSADKYVVLKNNLIDLKTRHESKEYIIDMKDAYTEAEIEDTGEDDEAAAEERSLSGEDKVEEPAEYESEEEPEDKEKYR